MQLLRALTLLLFFGALANAVSFQLSVSTQGTGFVSSYPSGILCGAACAESFDSGREITLTATAQDGAQFEGWEGNCSGSQLTCTFVISSAKSVAARFSGATLFEYLLSVYKSGDGSGTVQSDPYGITLGTIAPYDSSKFAAGTRVTLLASASSGSRFDGWSGDCSGLNKTCAVALNSAKKVTAVFSKSGSPTPSPASSPVASASPTSSAPAGSPTPTLKPVQQDFTLVITKASGQGAVRVWPIGRQEDLCGSSDKACVFTYAAGTSITLDVVSAPGNDFRQWSGDCSGELICKLVLGKNRSVQAAFENTAIRGTGQGGVGGAPGQSLTPTPVATPRPTPSNNPIYPLQVFITGRGSVDSGDGRIGCGEERQKCEAKYSRYEQVPLSARPYAGWKFVGWGGECRNAESEPCVVALDVSSLFVSTTQVRAVFEPLQHFVSVSIQGSGYVTDGSNRPPQTGRANIVEPTRLSQISCGGQCAAQYPTGSYVSLTAMPIGESTFEKWEGDCTGTSSNVCYITEVTSSRQVRAIFSGPPAPNKLNVEIVGDGAADGGVEVQAVGPGGKPVETKACNSNCSFEYKQDVQVGILHKANGLAVFEGFGGDCLGEVCPWMHMDKPHKVMLQFSRASFKRLTVVKPKAGTIYSQDYKIQCGEYYGNCSAEFDNRSVVHLKFSSWEEGLFEKGCSAVFKELDRNGYTPIDVCYVDMRQGRTVETKLSLAQEKSVARYALEDAFNRPDYPGLKEWVLQENGVAFQRTLVELRAGKTGYNSSEVAKWISGNWDLYLKELGVAKWMDDYDTNVVRTTLYSVFFDQASKNRALADFLYDKSKPPFRTALQEFLALHKQGEAKFREYMKTRKDFYLQEAGVYEFLKPTPTPTPIHREKKPPYIRSIRPQDSQVGKPTEIFGDAFNTVTQVTLNNDVVDFQLLPDGRTIRLPRVPWGMVLGVDAGHPAKVTVTNPGGSYTENLVTANGAPVTKNADGKNEECFGAVGPACTGLFDAKPGEASDIANRAGCKAPANGVRVCWVSTGSIRHDNCCVRYPAGKFCGGPGTDGEPAKEFNHDGNCAIEWGEATGDTFWARAWTETFDVSRPTDLTPFGTVRDRYPQGETAETTRLCAPRGHEMRYSILDKFCCSGKLDSWKKCE